MAEDARGCAPRRRAWAWRLGACSSVGQSARLISVRSAVQLGPGPPHLRWQMSVDRWQKAPVAGAWFAGVRAGSSERHDRWRLTMSRWRSMQGTLPSDICHLTSVL
jgi:hypothetical protein